MHNTEELLSNLAAINFLFKTGSEDYFIDNVLKGAYGTAFYPLYNMKQHKAEQKDNKLEIKKMKRTIRYRICKAQFKSHYCFVSNY